MNYLSVFHNGVDARFNLALEEHLLKNKKDFFIYLWVNSPSVIVGVNQNAMQEVNFSYTQKHDIKVVRRITGGGTVYHDLNNLCYSIIAPYDNQNDYYKLFTKPVIEYLNSLGVNAQFSGRNDITVGGKKISGNAQTVYKDRILHHGTILFKTDMQAMQSAITPPDYKMQSKGIKSVRARVTNVCQYLKTPMSATEFMLGLKQKLFADCKEYFITQEDISLVNRLVETKYDTFSWNVGSSPKSNLELNGKFDFGYISINLDVKDGLIENAKVLGDFFELKPIGEWAKKLLGLKLDANCLAPVFYDICAYVKGADANQLLKTFFGQE